MKPKGNEKYSTLKALSAIVNVLPFILIYHVQHFKRTFKIIKKLIRL